MSNQSFQNINIVDNQHDHLFQTNNNLKKPIGTTTRSIITEYLQDYEIMTMPEETIAPWNLQDIKVCTQGSKYSKNTNQVIQRLAYLEHLNNTHKGNEHIYTDGSKTLQGVGFAAVLPSKVIKGTLHKDTSIYTAELTAINAALIEIEKCPSKQWTIHTDSKSSIEAVLSLTGKHPIVSKIQTKLSRLKEKNYQVTLCKVPSHIGIEGNEKADQEAKSTVNIPGYYNTYIPVEDLKQVATRLIRELWQERWNLQTAKLKEIRPTIQTW